MKYKKNLIASVEEQEMAQDILGTLEYLYGVADHDMKPVIELAYNLSMGFYGKSNQKISLRSSTHSQVPDDFGLLPSLTFLIKQADIHSLKEMQAIISASYELCLMIEELRQRKKPCH